MMSDHPAAPEDEAALEREAIAWLLRITDEEATASDRRAMECWQSASPARAQAFARVSRMWHAMPSAVATLVRSGTVSVGEERPLRAASIGRRRLLIGLGAS